ncbi:hypothetical protein FQ082_02845 [Psychrobacter sp. ANT_H56B]|uniref:hypothetical protein n=1 Tax=Psychrobacter sp. ANT_H56B TaxID=2597353 RepID=UPI0011F38FD8|nr:hypothetical protein [Psychrobacter sp. ANT_H56B]KAA0928637.1 hypothetical protein FQ082_02845 [Psychrobacter sp. ANT_H56B]
MELNTSQKLELISKFDIDFEYGDVIYHENCNYFIIFNKERRSENAKFLAKLYDKKGKYLLTIPFPEEVINYQKINLMYSWGWEVENGVKVVFGGANVFMHDFWREFDFIKGVYTNRDRFY